MAVNGYMRKTGDTQSELANERTAAVLSRSAFGWSRRPRSLERLEITRAAAAGDRRGPLMRSGCGFPKERLLLGVHPLGCANWLVDDTRNTLKGGHQTKHLPPWNCESGSEHRASFIPRKFLGTEAELRGGTMLGIARKPVLKGGSTGSRRRDCWNCVWLPTGPGRSGSAMPSPRKDAHLAIGSLSSCGGEGRGEEARKQAFRALARRTVVCHEPQLRRETPHPGPLPFGRGEGESSSAFGARGGQSTVAGQRRVSITPWHPAHGAFYVASNVLF
jgi:hypothetical protein